MSRRLAAAVSAVAFPGLVCAALLCAALVVTAPAGATPSRLHVARALSQGERLVSPNGWYSAGIERTGRLVVRTKTGRVVWRTRPTVSHAHLVVRPGGQLAIRRSGITLWRAGTAGSGRSNVLRLRDDGVLALTSGRAVVWSNRLRNYCPSWRGKVVSIDVGSQTGRACTSGQQVRAFRVTTGMSAYGYGTPLGTWHVYAKTPNTTLYPAAGGAYPVKYWMPYSGPYGLHDSSWQDFPYGSPLYRTRGSHGCTHVPPATMAWLFGWAGIGTTVTIHG